MEDLLKAKELVRLYDLSEVQAEQHKQFDNLRRVVRVRINDINIQIRHSIMNTDALDLGNTCNRRA